MDPKCVNLKELYLFNVIQVCVLNEFGSIYSLYYQNWGLVNTTRLISLYCFLLRIDKF